MKNIILINANGEVLVSSVNDGTNTLYINEIEIDSSRWIGSGSYTDTVAGHTIRIAKAPDLSGNIQLIRISEYNYKLIKLRTFNSVLDVYQDGVSAVGSDGIARITGGSIAYATCSTAAGTAAKVATIVEGSIDSLTAGSMIAVKFTNTNTAANPTLKIGDLEAKAIKRYGTTAPSTSAASSWNAGSVILFIYDGTYWMMEDWINTTYSSMSVAEYEAGTSGTARLITPARLKAAIAYWTVTPDNYVIDEGTSGSWRYRKWNSGKIEAWYEGSVVCSTTTARGNVYTSTYSLAIPSDIGFTSAPYLIIGNNANTNNVIAIDGEASSATDISGYVWRPQSSTNTLTVQTRIYAWTD